VPLGSAQACGPCDVNLPVISQLEWNEVETTDIVIATLVLIIDDSDGSTTTSTITNDTISFSYPQFTPLPTNAGGTVVTTVTLDDGETNVM
jgi:hypothetical protein